MIHLEEECLKMDQLNMDGFQKVNYMDKDFLNTKTKVNK